MPTNAEIEAYVNNPIEGTYLYRVRTGCGLREATAAFALVGVPAAKRVRNTKVISY